jgi:heme exporter protein D
MYGLKVGPGAATGLGALAYATNLAWAWFFVALFVATVFLLVAQPIARRRRQAILSGVRQPRIRPNRRH